MKRKLHNAMEEDIQTRVTRLGLLHSSFYFTCFPVVFTTLIKKIKQVN